MTYHVRPHVDAKPRPTHVRNFWSVFWGVYLAFIALGITTALVVMLGLGSILAIGSHSGASDTPTPCLTYGPDGSLRVC